MKISPPAWFSPVRHLVPRELRCLAAVLFLLAAAFEARPVMAACPDAPLAWDAASCNSVCSYDGPSKTWTCTLGQTASSIHVIEDSGTYQAFGSTGSPNALFCCEIQEDVNMPIEVIKVYGTDYDDNIQLQFGGAAHNLAPADGLVLDVYVYANDGNDSIKGSDYGNSIYTEYLHGEDGNDTIAGYGGDDFLYGGSGDDTLLGGAGDDYMEGNDGNDEMVGGAGFDTMLGGSGRDFMSGGDDDDIMDGGSGGDVMCGDDGDDVLDDGDNMDEGAFSDILWGATSGDTDYCNDSSTTWDGNAIGPCPGNPTISSRPALCP